MSPNAKIAGNGVILRSHAESKVPSVSNATVPTNLSTIGSLVGAVRLTLKLTHLD